MKLLPNFQSAIIPIEKLRDYCLSEEHADGKHKAIVFKSQLGLLAKDAEWLKEKIAEAITSNNAITRLEDDYGKRFHLDFKLKVNMKTATVRTAWIIRTSETEPRLTSCYIIS